MNPIPPSQTLPLPPIVLDDGQVIQGKFGELTQPQLISLANQLRRNKNNHDADSVMAYQHKKFWQTENKQ